MFSEYFLNLYDLLKNRSSINDNIDHAINFNSMIIAGIVNSNNKDNMKKLRKNIKKYKLTTGFSGGSYDDATKALESLKKKTETMVEQMDTQNTATLKKTEDIKTSIKALTDRTKEMGKILTDDKVTKFTDQLNTMKILLETL